MGFPGILLTNQTNGSSGVTPITPTLTSAQKSATFKSGLVFGMRDKNNLTTNDDDDDASHTCGTHCGEAVGNALHLLISDSRLVLTSIFRKTAV